MADYLAQVSATEEVLSKLEAEDTRLRREETEAAENLAEAIEEEKTAKDRRTVLYRFLAESQQSLQLVEESKHQRQRELDDIMSARAEIVSLAKPTILTMYLN